MTVAIRTTERDVASPAPTADRIQGLLRAAADGIFPVTCPPVADIERAQKEIEAEITNTCTASFAAREIGKLVMAFPQKSAEAEKLKVYVATLVEAALEYPEDIVLAAKRTIIRKAKFLPAPAEFYEAADEAMAPRRTMLHGAGRLLAEALARQRKREEDERRALERLADIRRLDDAIEARFGSLVPHWCSVQKAWAAIQRCNARLGLLIEARAGAGHPVAFVQIRRAALLGFALELERRAFEEPGRMYAIEVLEVARTLLAGQDREAERQVLAVLDSTKPDGDRGDFASWGEINATMGRCLAYACAHRAALAEGLIVDVDTTPVPA